MKTGRFMSPVVSFMGLGNNMYVLLVYSSGMVSDRGYWSDEFLLKTGVHRSGNQTRLNPERMCLQVAKYFVSHALK
jgi:hypothetical protein